MMRNDYDSDSENGKKRKCPESCWSPTYLGWMEGGGQQTEPGPGQALIELATGQVRNFWGGQEGLGVKGSPGPALPFLFQGGQSGEGARSLQPSVLSEEKINQMGHPTYPPPPRLPHILTPSGVDSNVALQGSPCVRSDWGRMVEPEHPGWEPGAAGPGWGSQERRTAGTGGVSAHGGTALGKKLSHFPRTLPLPGSCFPHRWGPTPSATPARTLILLTCRPAPPGPW